MTPFKALIVPISDGEPAHPIVIPPGLELPDLPVFIWGPNDPRPTNPIVIPPDAIAPGVPAHPIVFPPEIWGPTDPRPGYGLPGDQPEVGKPEFPTNPIAPGGPPPVPAHPIVLPDPPAVADDDKALVLVVTAETGPVWFVIDANDGLGNDNRPPTAGPKRKK